MHALAAAPWWLLLFAALGLVAVAAVVAALFLPDWHRQDLTAAELPPAGTPEYIATVATLLNVPVLRGEAEYLPNGDRFYPAILDAIRSAQDTINFQVYIFDPDDTGTEFIEAFIERARAGVDVRLLLPGEHIDNASARYSAQNHYEALMEAGVKIHEYRPTFIHSKIVVVDGVWSIVGTPNLNSRSRQLDEENAFAILDRDFGAQLEATFLQDAAQADRIELEVWRRRNPLLRLVQLFSRVLDQQS